MLSLNVLLRFSDCKNDNNETAPLMDLNYIIKYIFQNDRPKINLKQPNDQ